MDTTWRLTRRMMALVLSAVLAAPGCASMARPRVSGSGPILQASGHAVIAEYVQTLPPGSKVRVSLSGGRSLRGTLLKATGERLVVQPKGRLPEPPLDIPFTQVLEVALDSPGGTGRMIAIGAAAGAGAALAVLLTLAAIFSD